MTHKPPRGLTYREAGVDVVRKAAALEGLAATITDTHHQGVGAWGAFSGLVQLPGNAGMLAVTIDGVGTKTVLARRLGADKVIGADIVAHCANDLAAGAARPLAFVDYVAMPALDERLLESLIGGMAEACRTLNIPLIGGETAEMPGIYAEGTYDVVGTMIGMVVDDVSPARVRSGDVLIGLASTGLHTNGFSLARAIVEDLDLAGYDDELGMTLAEALVAPHRCYAPALLELLGVTRVHGLAHITGGGLPGNIRRALPTALSVRLSGTWPMPPIFRFLQRRGDISDEEMQRTFNIGIGMVVVTAPEDATRAVDFLHNHGEEAWMIGEVVEGPGQVIFERSPLRGADTRA